MFKLIKNLMINGRKWGLYYFFDILLKRLDDALITLTLEQPK